MNYIELINNAWKLRIDGYLSEKEFDLYLFLLHKANQNFWEMPFSQPTNILSAFLKINRNALTERRNKLKQLGLIDFEGGEKNSTPAKYTILCIFLDTKTNTKTNTKTDTKTNTIILKQKQNKEKKREKGAGALDDAVFFVEVNSIAAYLKSDEIWVEAFCMNNRVKKDELFRLADDFQKHLINQNAANKNKRDIFPHFSNWIKKKPKDETTKTTYIIPD